MSQDNSQYRNSGQQRLLQVMGALSGNDLTGITTTEVATKVGCPVVTAYRDLVNLEMQQFAERLPDDQERWRTGTALLAMYRQYASGLRTGLTELFSRLNCIG